MVRRSFGFGKDVEKESGSTHADDCTLHAAADTAHTDGHTLHAAADTTHADGRTLHTHGGTLHGTAHKLDARTRSLLVLAFLHGSSARTPNDPKLSDRGGAARHLPHGWNVGQMTELQRTVERRKAGAVTRRSGSLQRMVRAFETFAKALHLGRFLEYLP